ncbi:hypothetical protein OS493_035882 [Desmophyllum pertusum]|uniref:Uncharacterized protein n=1 Tax=Desmophyllum pertusum TaxID=174260 RepID=A0A9X0D0K0_9CNID|nr:hypothetical protein OS493_035882 [Desmophyllum pertusum]
MQVRVDSSTEKLPRVKRLHHILNHIAEYPDSLMHESNVSRSIALRSVPNTSVYLLKKEVFSFVNPTYMSFLFLPSSSKFFLGKIRIECCLSKSRIRPLCFDGHFLKEKYLFHIHVKNPNSPDQLLFQGIVPRVVHVARNE